MGKIDDLFDDAQDEGLISSTSAAVLAVPDIGNQITAALGVTIDQVRASEVVLVNLLIDNTVSMDRMTDAVISGQNECIDALAGTKQAEAILAVATFLDGSVLHPFQPIEEAVRLDRSNYRAYLGHTPLYDATLRILALVVAKTQEFRSNGVPVRSITLIATDGGDNSSRWNAQDVRSVVSDMLASEAHLVAGLGIDDGMTDFRRVFADIGIPDEWILTPGQSASEIRQAFRLFSQSAVQVSQTASLSSVGGFGR